MPASRFFVLLRRMLAAESVGLVAAGCAAGQAAHVDAPAGKQGSAQRVTADYQPPEIEDAEFPNYPESYLFNMYDVFGYGGITYFDKASASRNQKRTLIVYRIDEGQANLVCEYRFSDR